MNQDYYDRILDGLDDEVIARYDREESGYQYGGTMEHEQGGGAYTFTALDRGKRAAILRAISKNLPTRTKRPNTRTATSYTLKHMTERYTGFYVSNLQLKVAMRILGYTRTPYGLNPVYNISVRDCRAFSDAANEARRKREAAA